METLANLAELNRLTKEARIVERAIDDVFHDADITEVVLKAGGKTLAVKVSATTGLAVAHELLLAAIETREGLEKQLGAAIPEGRTTFINTTALRQFVAQDGATLNRLG